MTQQQTVKDVLESDVGRTLLRLSVPMVAAMSFMGAVAVADSLFVARLGTDPLAALGVAVPIVSLLLQFFIGYGAGLTSVVARAVTSEDPARLASLTVNGMLLGLVAGVVVGQLATASIPWCVSALGANSAAALLAGEYVRVWLWGVPFYMLSTAGTAIARGNGDTLSSGVASLIAAGVNLLLDPLFIFGWGPVAPMGVRGAALATVVGYVPAALFSCWILCRGDAPLLQWRRLGARESLDVARTTLPIAAASVLALLTVPFTGMAITYALSDFGASAIAAFGVVYRVQSLVGRAPLAVAAAMGPMAGMFWSAGRLERLAAVIRIAQRSVVHWGIACAVVVAAAVKFTTLAITEADTRMLAGTMLLVAAAGFPSYGRVAVANSVYSHIGGVRTAFSLVCLRIVTPLPLAWAGGRIGGALGVTVSLPLASILVDLMAQLWMRAGGLLGSNTAGAADPVRS